MSLTFSRVAARSLLLTTQGLTGSPPIVGQTASKDDVLAIIRRMGALQIDTIQVVARSPYLVLWSRLGSYEPRWLNELLAEGALFEYWSHAACFLPIESYRLYRRKMLDEHPRAQAWLAEHPDEVSRVRQKLHEQGEVRAVNFTRTTGRSSGWWDWKPEKIALEYLFSLGEVMIARRDANFQRIYVPREHLVPDWDDATVPSSAEVWRELTLSAVWALGVVTPNWPHAYFNTNRRGVAALLESCAEDGVLVRATIEGISEPAYIHRDHLSLAQAALDGALPPARTTLLSPFDPLVWDRARALALFDFHYRIEAYTPAAKRRFGYFTLPILHDGTIVGRLDAKAHRQNGLFEVRALHLEPGVPMTDDLLVGLAGVLLNCATWHRTPDIVVRQSDPAHLAQAITMQMKGRFPIQ